MTVIEIRLAGPTVSVVLPVTEPAVALIWDVPWPVPVARPPAVMLATALFDDAQTTLPVRSAVELSVYVPVAENGCVVPLAIVGFVGETATETSAAGPTVRLAPPVTAPTLAVICVVPCPVPLASPPVVTVATAEFDVAQVADPVKS